MQLEIVKPLKKGKNNCFNLFNYGTTASFIIDIDIKSLRGTYYDNLF